MRATEAISALLELIEEHGDVNLVTENEHRNIMFSWSEKDQSILVCSLRSWSEFLKSGKVYAPYVPLQITRTTEEDSG